MTNILASFALNMGRQIEYQKEEEQRASEQQARAALADLRTQEVADAQFKQQEQRRLQGVRQQIGAKISEAQAGDANDVKSLHHNANTLARYAAELTSTGDYEGGKQLMEQSKGMVQEAKTLQETQLKAQADATEAAAGAALDAQQAPTPENLKVLAQAAVKAGMNPLDIPAPGTPQMQTFINKLANQGLKAKDRVKIAEDEKQRKEDRDWDVKKFNAEQEEKRRQRAQTAAYQSRMASIAEQELQLKRDKANNLEDGGALSKPMQDSIQKVNQAAPQLAQQFELLSQFSPGTTLSAFAQLKPGAVISESLAKAGTTVLSSQEQQLMAATAKGAGVVMGRLIQATEGGRALTQSQQDTQETAMSPMAGETALTAAFKLARMSEEVTSMLDHLPLKRMPDWQQEMILKTRDRFKTPVSSMELLKIAQKIKDPKVLQQMMTASATLESAMTNLKRTNTGPVAAPAAPTPAAAPAAPAVPTKPSLPPGWGVTVK